MPKYTVGLSAKGFRDLAKQIRDYRIGLQEMCEKFARKLAEEGVQIAKMRITSKEAVYTEELLNSMNLEQGDIIYDGASFCIYTDCPWAKFVEFGTGIVGSKNPHPDTSIVGWKYDTNEHGEKGWYYFKDDKLHWTKGMPSRPFMYETAKELRNMELMIRIAKEVFGDD